MLESNDPIFIIRLIFTFLIEFVRKSYLEINEKVNKLTVETLSMEHILSAVNYPHLHSLALLNCQAEILLKHLTGMFKNFV